MRQLSHQLEELAAEWEAFAEIDQYKFDSSPVAYEYCASSLREFIETSKTDDRRDERIESLEAGIRDLYEDLFDVTVELMDANEETNK